MRKNTKSALLLSVVSIIVCCTMLLGTTMAWFTDSVTSAKNVIVAGNLDVELYHTNPDVEDEKIDETTGLFFVDVNGDEILWEPGVISYEKFTVKNVGTLALQYKLLMHVYDATANADGKTLEEVIKVATADTVPTTRADVEDLDFIALSEFEVKSEKWLEPDDDDATTTEKSSEDLIVVLYWEPSDVDNDYNMNNENKGTELKIEFGVNLIATQEDYEEDSFGKDYDDIDVPDMITENIDGVTYGTTITGDYVMVSVDDYTLTNFTVDEDVTVLGTGNGVYDNDRVFGKNAPLTSLTLPEGLVEIKDNALNALPNLTTVNLPSTLKTIGIQAFRTAGMSELTVPESVETVKLGAFRDMANLTTVTVEGDVAFDNYAFRSCPNLTSIYLLGDDVTFTGSQFATHSDNGDANGITIYVKNATVAARVYTAQGSAYGYEVKILSDATDGSYATLATTSDELVEALGNGEDVALMSDIKIDPANMSNAYGKTGINVKNGQTIDGNGHTLDIKDAGGTWDSGINTTGGIIKNLTVTGSFRGIFINHNSDHSEKVVLENVIIDGTVYTISCDQGTNNGLAATNCTFNGWTSYAATLGAATFTNCSFGEGSGYAFCRPYAPTTFVGCDFEAGYEMDPRAAVTFENCTIDGVALTAENLSTLVTSNIANASVK